MKANISVVCTFHNASTHYVNPSGGADCVLGLGLHFKFIQDFFNYIL